ncbi:MAG: isopentenyl phosphate kinase family protein [Chloroflexi bacterium]|nr:isopentenyl phosphate kinase family protein [Chloroflexota bacterium]
MITFVKLGGSLITDKQVEARFRQDVAERTAAEIAAALREDPNLRILLGHGSGSFGHVAAKKYRTIEGVHTPEEWRGFAEVATTAAELNYLIAKTLRAAGIPVWRIQPSASAIAVNGRIGHMSIASVQHALEHGLVPLVYGDVAVDTMRGGTIISTETIFFYLAQHLPVQRILLLGQVAGVYDLAGVLIPAITPANITAIESALGGSDGTDVTGGMETKVRDMLALTQALPGLTIRIMDGTQPDLLRQTLLGQVQPGTLISQAG